MKTILIFLILIFLLLNGCENEEIISTDVVYEEYTVVQAELRAYENFPGVRFTKTIPLGVPYRIEDAELVDVTAYIKKNGVQIIPLIYNSDGLYTTLYDVFVSEGETYELFADYKGKFIYSKTIIPFRPEITGLDYNTSEYYLSADVNTKANEVYAALWIISGIPPEQAEDFFAVYSNNPNSLIRVKTSTLPEQFRSNLYSGRRYIEVFSFDKSFENYFKTRTSGSSINDPFVQGGGETSWNVQGDKVIGLFIGISSQLPQQVN